MTTRRALGNGLVGSIVVVAAMALAAPAAVGGPAVRTGPKGDAFYTGKAKAGARNGDVVWARSVRAPAGARAWKILYKSQAVNGKPVTVSGIVVVPKKKAPKGGFPVVTWAHGTTGLADSCAPSKDASAAANVPWIDRYLKAGYAVAATDYEGLGTPGLHPYLVGASEGRGVLDAARAARRIPDAHTSNRVVIFGHSQGGHAALFAGEIAPTYAPDLKIVGTAAAAPAAELKLLLGAAAGVDSFLGYVTMGGRGFGAAYPEAQQALTTVMTPKGLKDSDVVETKCSDAVNEVMNQPAAQVIAKNPLDVPPFPELIEQNTPANVKTASPMLVVQGDQDPLVIAGTTDSFVERACAVGDSVQYLKYAGADHGGVMIKSEPDVLAWMKARFANTAENAAPAPLAASVQSSCGSTAKSP